MRSRTRAVRDRRTEAAHTAPERDGDARSGGTPTHGAAPGRCASARSRLSASRNARRRPAQQASLSPSAFAVRAASPHNVRRAPVRLRREHAHVGLHELAVRGSRKRSSRAICGRNRPTVCARSGTRTPGHSSAVSAMPPTVSRASSNQHAQPGAAQVRGAHQAVVPGADHDRVVAPERRVKRPAPRRPSPERRAATAQHRHRGVAPGAPVMTPPGWVEAPHSHRSRTGVR